MNGGAVDSDNFRDLAFRVIVALAFNNHAVDLVAAVYKLFQRYAQRCGACRLILAGACHRVQIVAALAVLVGDLVNAGASVFDIVTINGADCILCAAIHQSHQRNIDLTRRGAFCVQLVQIVSIQPFRQLYPSFIYKPVDSVMIQEPRDSLVKLCIVIFRAVSDLVLCCLLDVSRQHIDLRFGIHRRPLVQNVFRCVLCVFPCHSQTESEHRAQAIAFIGFVIDSPGARHDRLDIVLFHFVYLISLTSAAARCISVSHDGQPWPFRLVTI